MCNLLINELKKINVFNVLLVSIVVFIGINILGHFSINGNTVENWRENAIKEREENYKFIEQIENEENSSKEEIKESCQKVIDEIDYCLENDIPYGVVSVGGYVLNMSGMDTFVILVIVIFSVRILGIENESKTWKNILTTETGVKKVLVSKVITGIILSITLVIIFQLTSLVMGAVLSGGEFISYIRIWQNGQYIERSVFAEITASGFIIILKGLFFSMFTIMISALTKKGYITYLVSILMLLFGDAIADIIEGYKISKVLPFRYIYSTVDNIFFEDGFVFDASVVLIPFIILMILVSVLGFDEKNTQ